MSKPYSGENTIKAIIKNSKASFATMTHNHSWDDLNDKPFGEDKTIQYVIKDEETAFGLLYIQSYQLLNKLVDNTEYTIEVNGTTYKDVYTNRELGDSSYVEYPFYASMGSTRLDIKSPDDITISIYTEVDAIKTIDEQYIPDTIARKSDLESIDLSSKADVEHTHSFNDLEDKPFYEEELTEISVIENVSNSWSKGELPAVLFDPEIELKVGTKYKLTGTATIHGDEINFTEEVICVDDVLEIILADVLITISSNMAFFSEEGTASLTISIYELQGGITYLDEKFIPDTIARKSDLESIDIPEVDLTPYETKEDAQLKYDEITSAKADWNQNDESAIDYIYNRTHWVEVEEETAEFLSETVITEVEADAQGRSFSAISELNNTWFIIDNNTFIVTFDGVQYRCPAWNYNGNDYFGNANLLDSEFLESTTELNQYKSDAPFLFESIFYSEEETDPFWGETTYNEWFEFNIYIQATEVGATHTLKIEYVNSENSTYHTLDEKYIPDTIARKSDIKGKMDISNPTGNGSFSLNRKGTTTVGNYSVAMGRESIASGNYSIAMGGDSIASGDYSIAMGSNSIASGIHSVAEGYMTEASGGSSHAEGWHTKALSKDQHVQGKYNIEDTEERYAHIVGNGTDKQGIVRSNAHTLDWEGNAWFAGNIKVGGTSYDDASEVALKFYVDANKKDKDLIVTFADDSKTTATHTSQEIYEAIQNGTTVYFNNGGTNFNYLEGLPSIVTFYNCFYNNSVMQADVYEIRGTEVTNNHFQNDIVTQSYVNTSIADLKDDLLNGAGEAYDTLKELGDLIDENTTALDALKEVASGKADKDHKHSWNDLEDKPFGEEYTENEIVNTTLDFSTAQYVEDFTSHYLTVGTRYIVTWNGVEYDCIAKDGGDTYTYLGSQQMSPGWEFPETIESDEPFFIATSQDYSHTTVSTSSNTSVEFKMVEMVAGSVKQLDEKYIPDTIARVDDVNSKIGNLEVGIYESKDGSYKADVPFAEIVEAYYDWKNIVAYTGEYYPLSAMNANGIEDGGYEGTIEFSNTFLRPADETENAELIPFVEKITLFPDGTVAWDVVNPGGVASWNDLSDRPFYAEDPVETTLVDNVSVTINSDNGYAQLPTAFAMENNMAYRVTFDGVDYICDAYIMWGVPVIGNGTIAGGTSAGNNEPFLCVGSHKLVYAATAGTHTVTVVELRSVIHQLPEKYISYKPGRIVEGTTSAEVFNDYANNTATGDYSHAEGQNSDATGDSSHAEGSNTTASGNSSHAEGGNTTASGNSSHAEGSYTTAEGDYSHAEGRSTTASGTHSHAQGYETTASGDYSHAEGQKSTASGYCAHAGGYNSLASGDYSHAEGSGTKASSANQHVQGKYNVEDAASTYAHIVGNGTNDSNRSNAHTVDWQGNGWFAGKVYVGGTSKDDGVEVALKSDLDNLETNYHDELQLGLDGKMNKDNPVGTGSFSMNRLADSNVGLYSSTVGCDNTATGDYSHAEGHNTNSSNLCSHAEGSGTRASGAYSHAEGNGTYATTANAHAEGKYTTVCGGSGHAEGMSSNKGYDYIEDSTTIDNVIAAWNSNKFTAACGAGSHAEGKNTLALDTASHSEGNKTKAIGLYSHAEGNTTTAEGESSHAEGSFTSASVNSSHAEGSGTSASGEFSHAEGSGTIAEGEGSHAEGSLTVAFGANSHAEGMETEASNECSHAEGYNTIASGERSHAEGTFTTASGANSHAEGNRTTASGMHSHAEGHYTTASGVAQHVQGRYNIEDTEEKYAHIVGNGTSNTARSNIHTIDWNGNGWFVGDIYVGGTSGINRDESSKKLATEEYVLEKIAALEALLVNGNEVAY